MKKILAAIMTLCIVGGTMPAVYSGAPDCVITASAANYEEITDGVLHYRVYADHAELISSVEKVEGEINIPSIVNEVTVTGIADYAFYECINLTSIKATFGWLLFLEFLIVVGRYFRTPSLGFSYYQLPPPPPWDAPEEDVWVELPPPESLLLLVRVTWVYRKLSYALCTAKLSLIR